LHFEKAIIAIMQMSHTVTSRVHE